MTNPNGADARPRPRELASPRERASHPSAPPGDRIRWTDRSGSWHYVPSRSPRMRSVEERALRVAPSPESVLILGETGVGKDLLARLIHQNSDRRDRAFVHLNCAALAEGLLESELFGHLRGSYTGATESRPGQFEVASGGTLFLDEIGELPPRLQAKLLHVLQEKKIYRVGGRQPLEVDVRVLAATNRDLTLDMRSGAFRRDLYYRLGVVTLKVPSLRDRLEDLDDIALHFFRRYAALYNRPDLSEPEARFFRLLRNSTWEGNIRELENVVKRVILLGGVENLQEEMSRAAFGEGDASAEPVSSSVESVDPPHSLRDVARSAVMQAERRAILETLHRTAWNRKRAARELRVSYRSLLYKIKDYTLRPAPPAPEQDSPSRVLP